MTARAWKRYDWFNLKAEYVEGIERDGKRIYPTKEELSARYGPSVSRIEHRFADEGWHAERGIFANKITAARQEKTTEILATKGAMFDSSALRIAEAMISQIQFHLAKSAEAKQALAPAMLRTLSSTLQTAMQVGRLAMGDVTDNTGQVVKEANKVDLSKLTDEELAAYESMTRKMLGLPDA
jgi:hypothetical protein